MNFRGKHLIASSLGAVAVLSKFLNAATINVPAGGDFHNALQIAAPGDTIVLQAGAVYYTGGSSFGLPDKGSKTQYITIQSSELNTLPAANYRVKPADVPRMPKLLSSANGVAVISAEKGAHHYRFVGIEMAPQPGNWVYTVAELGGGDERALAQLPHHITIDRCYIHGDTRVVPGTKRGVQLNGAHQEVLNSYISAIAHRDVDSQGVAGWSGPGPFRIINNYIEGSGENVIFGGQAPPIRGVIPSDIEFRNNYLRKPMSWKADDRSYAGTNWSIKNLFELKNARRVVVDGNIFENCWVDGQTGFAILFTPRGQGGEAPWSGVSDVLFTRNIVRNASSGFQFLSDDDKGATGGLQRITLRDNLIYNINSSAFGGDGRLFQFIGAETGMANDWTIDHNTAIHQGPGNALAVADSSARRKIANRFKFTNNLATYGNYGFKAGGEGTDALNQYFTNWTFTHNALIDGGLESNYPIPTFFAPTLESVQFASLKTPDYSLQPSSPYKSRASDGKDIGADMSAVLAATCGTLLGTPTCSAPPQQQFLGTELALNLPAYLPLNAQISASYNGSSASRFVWSFTPVTSVAAARSTPSTNRAPVASFTTDHAQANLAGAPLGLGPYQITVQVYESGSTPTAQADAYVTLVPADFAAIRVYPNPWRKDRHSGTPITFDQLTTNTTIKIFTVAGHLVRTLPRANTRVIWDLKNDSGDAVASGLYLYLLESDKGSKTRGKLVVIH
jgi:hypothetical protein